MFYKVALWIDDVRPVPANYTKNIMLNVNRVIWCRSVHEAITEFLDWSEQEDSDVYVIDLDHDAGDFAFDGGDYINFLNWMEMEGFDFTRFTWRIHSMNPVGVQNMLAILRRNGVEC